METNIENNNDLEQVIKWLDRYELQQQIDVPRHWKQVCSKIRRARYRRQTMRFARNAAAILFLPLLIAAGLLLRTPSAPPEPVEQIEITAAYGQITKITLPDRSEVWLNSGSKLTYPQRFEDETRAVQLAGEAYFKVESDDLHRFEVLLPAGLRVSACGTEFNIDAYPEDENMKMTLAKGRIEVQIPSQDALQITQAGAQTIYSKTNLTTTASNVNLYVETAWKDGKIVLRRAGMNEIISQLSRRFNVDIQLQGKELYGYEYSATFTTESITEILSLLEKSAPIVCRIIEPKQGKDFSFSKRTVIIRRKN
ncbi:MAG: DUF4974 domain-containing protein [Tannerella sp.]|nr:DUF4974 domain-containing protein [Tannerella sp.]